MSANKTSTTYGINITDKNMRLKLVFEDGNPLWTYVYSGSSKVEATENTVGTIDKYIHGKTLPPDNVVINGSPYKGKNVDNFLKKTAKDAIKEAYPGKEIADENVKIIYDINAANIDKIVEYLTKETRELYESAPRELEIMIKNMHGFDTKISDVEILGVEDLKYGTLIFPGHVDLVSLMMQPKRYVELKAGEIPFYTKPSILKNIQLLGDKASILRLPIPSNPNLDIIIEDGNDSTPAKVLDKLGKELQSMLESNSDDSHIRFTEIILTDKKPAYDKLTPLYMNHHGGLKVRAEVRQGKTLDEVAESVKKMTEHFDEAGLNYRFVDPNSQPTIKSKDVQ